MQNDFLAALLAYLFFWIIQPRFRPIGNISVLSLYRSPPICQLSNSFLAVYHQISAGGATNNNM
jgi:hypothetical protein